MSTYGIYFNRFFSFTNSLVKVSKVFTKMENLRLFQENHQDNKLQAISKRFKEGKVTTQLLDSFKTCQIFECFCKRNLNRKVIIIQSLIKTTISLEFCYFVKSLYSQ